MPRLAIRLFVMLVIILVQAEAMAQCVSNADCKGNRVCVEGACASSPEPKSLAEPLVSPAAPAEAPDPCVSVACSGQGTCAVVNGAAQCQCNEGFETDSSGVVCNIVSPPPAAAVVAPPVAAAPVSPPLTPAPVQTQPPPQQIIQNPSVSQPVLAVPQPEAAATPVDNTSVGTKKRRAGHAFFWSGLGLVGIGGISTGIAYSAAQDYNERFRNDDEMRARAWTGMMWTGYTLGVALMTAGIILWVSASDENERPVALAPFLSDRDFGLSLTGRW